MLHATPVYNELSKHEQQTFVKNNHLSSHPALHHIQIDVGSDVAHPLTTLRPHQSLIAKIESYVFLFI